ncbi:hypothetical protein OG799_14265 [Micromonospora sp. NBC_00898]|uniref:hypothetical protein n=1 Tax=Micromonospora sp. NBC_00898 TaxID=2975981 RepID=UPI00386CD050|nr:hypothetical protein OG799_14265 [Micromonospora sp. NBC_00898]
MAKNAGGGGAAVVGVVVALVLGLFLLPVVGTIWGLWVILCWLVRRGGEQAPTTGKAVLGACVVVVSVALGAAIYPAAFKQDAPVSAASAGTTPTPLVSISAAPVSASPSPTVPYVVGSNLSRATGMLVRDFDLRADWKDHSPLGRNIVSDTDWTVVATDPPVGTAVPPKTQVTLFALKESEVFWFSAHPVMPPLPKNAPTDSLLEGNGLLAGVRELVLVRYAKGKAPAGAKAAVDARVVKGSEPAQEVKARAGLKVAHPSDSVVVSSIPSAAQPVRQGRLIVVTVKDMERTTSSGGNGDGNLPYIPGNDDDDDDFNVPGWLCPTRFC